MYLVIFFHFLINWFIIYCFLNNLLFFFCLSLGEVQAVGQLRALWATQVAVGVEHGLELADLLAREHCL
jgi:hypothetical protein